MSDERAARSGEAEGGLRAPLQDLVDAVVLNVNKDEMQVELRKAQAALAEHPEPRQDQPVAEQTPEQVAAELGLSAPAGSLPAEQDQPVDRASGERITHGRHCICSACAAQDWSEPQLAPCGMHGPSCPPVYAPLGAPGALVKNRGHELTPAEHPETGERPERKMSVYEDGERGGVLQPETGEREACCSDPDLHPSTGGNRQCLGCGKTTAPREADLPDADTAAAEYEETKRRVIAGKASVYEAQEFIDFIEGAITNPPQPLQDGADQHGPNHPAHKHPRQLGDGPMCDCFREGWDSCDSLANARRAKSAQYLRENPDPPLQDGGEGSCCDCGKPLTVDDTPSICADCSQRLDEAFIDDAVPWLGLDRHEEARRQFRGGWLARAALPPEHPHQDVEPARHEIRTILSRFTLSDDEWLCIDNLLSRLGHQDVGRLSPDADAPRPKPDRDPSSLLFVPEAVRRMRVFVARIEEDEREQAKRQADKERVQT